MIGLFVLLFLLVVVLIMLMSWLCVVVLVVIYVVYMLLFVCVYEYGDLIVVYLVVCGMVLLFVMFGVVVFVGECLNFGV